MKTDKETGAPQFTSKDMKSLGLTLKQHCSILKNYPYTYVVTIDDVNLWLRVFLRRKKAKTHSRQTERKRK